MSRSLDTFSSLIKKQDVILNAICLLFAAVFLLLAASNVGWAGNFISIDSLFITTVFLLLAGVFLISPALWARENGLFKNLFAVDDETTGSAAHAEPIHFAGTTKLFLSVLGGLLLLTFVEVFLAYIHLPIKLMLVILIGLSLVKAGMILAYFMHLRYERMSLVYTLLPALVVCICLLFVFFPDSLRLLHLRSY